MLAAAFHFYLLWLSLFTLGSVVVLSSHPAVPMLLAPGTGGAGLGFKVREAAAS